METQTNLNLDNITTSQIKLHDLPLDKWEECEGGQSFLTFVAGIKMSVSKYNRGVATLSANTELIDVGRYSEFLWNYLRRNITEVRIAKEYEDNELTRLAIIDSLDLTIPEDLRAYKDKITEDFLL